MNHPLTDEMLEQEQFRSYLLSKDVEELWHTRDDMRAAADWQLEQVIRYLENDLEFVLWSDHFMDNFKKAMRPQENI